MKKTITKRLMSLVLAMAMIACVFGIYPKTIISASAYSYSGPIYRNGLGGIYIDLNSYPYNALKNGYEYGPSGCAWYASCRAKAFADQVGTIWGANSWLNVAGNYGFTVDMNPSAGSIMCWTTGNNGNGHVAILEKIDGNTAYISEGGTSYDYDDKVYLYNNSYCRLYSTSVNSMTSKKDANGNYMNFGGYVHFCTSSPAPTEATITTDTTKYILGDTVYLHAFSNNNPLTYIFCIYKDGKRVKEVNTGSNPLAAFSSNDLGVGNYSVYVFCANNAGYKDSQYIDFEIVYPAPTEASITTDTSRYILGDTVYLHAFANNHPTKYIFCIYQNGTRIKEIDTNDNNTASFPSSELGVGEYSAYVFCANSVSYKDSDYIDFEIVYPAPTEAVIYSNKQTYSLTDDIVLNATANNHPSTYIFCIYKDGKRIKEYNTGDNSQVEFNASELGIGEYSVYVFCANKISYKDSDYISFNIVENKCEGGHSFGSWITKEASTCSQAGVEYRSCTVCKKIETRNLEKKPHVYSMYETPATCTTDGVKTFTCTACKDSYTETIKATGHKTTATTAKAATCTTAGNTAYWYCSTCKKYFSDSACTKEITLASTVIPATGHKTTATPAKAATCTTAGNTAYWYCSTCKKYFSDSACTKEITLASTVIPATGHKTTATAAKAATCTTAGNSAYWYCSTCKKYFSDSACTKEITLASTVIPATAHKYTDTVVAPTTEQKGYTLHKCTVCGHEYIDTYTDPLPKPTRKKGDINNNGRIDAADLLQVKSHIKKVKLLTGDDFWAADIDDNKVINAADLLKIKSHIKGVSLLWS